MIWYSYSIYICVAPHKHSQIQHANTKARIMTAMHFQDGGQRRNTCTQCCVLFSFRKSRRIWNHLLPMSGRSFLSYSFSKLFNICVASVSWALGASIWFTVTSSYSSSYSIVWELQKSKGGSKIPIPWACVNTYRLNCANNSRLQDCIHSTMSHLFECDLDTLTLHKYVQFVSYIKHFTDISR